MKNSIRITEGFRNIAASFTSSGFTTKDFVDRYSLHHPTEWEAFVVRYGKGGRGSGHPYSANSRIGSMLGVLFRAGDLHRFPEERAPEGWGANWIRRWAVSQSGALADEAANLGPPNAEDENVRDVPPWADREYREGTPKLRTHLRRERHSQLSQDKKAAFRSKHGKLFCERCALVPSKIYGDDFGDAVIEVHHTVMVSGMGSGGVTALSELQCLCANCHRVVHAELRGKANADIPAASI